MLALGRKLSLSLLAACLLPCDEDACAAEYGLDAPEAIPGFLNGVFPTKVPGPSGGWAVQRVYPNVAANLPTFCGVYPGTNTMLIVEKAGRILKFDNSATATATEVFLDIQESVYSNSDSGMTYFAFHPEFGQAGSPNRGYVYVTYKYSPNGDTGTLAYWRLSRFTVQDGTTVADPASEQILIQQFDRQQWHDSGCLLFGTDGFLYVGIGDEGGAGDQYDDSQKINDRLFSGILRIDVNQDATKSHPIRRQPLPQAAMPEEWPASYTANYYIPNDNPWVNPDGSVLEEFYAMGFRNPYRFNMDPETGKIWVGDVGQDLREEVDLLVKGGNYGWAFREGNTSGPKTVPENIIGTLQEPKFVYDRSLGGCVVTGYFYHGTQHPSLVGKLLIVDNTSGRIWALAKGENDLMNAEYLCSMPSGSVYSGTVACVQEHGGEIYFLKLGNSYRGEFYRLARTGSATPEPPALLSATGAFTNLASLTPRNGLIPYDVNAPLWSDAALKKRWISVPNDGVHNLDSEKIKFNAESEWTFPAGTVFVKHFELATDESNPSAIRKLETRFLVISSTGEPYGVTYRWRPDGSDADLLSVSTTDTISVALAGGGTRTQTWSYPSRSDCMICHNSNAKYVLGVKTWQLNGDMMYPKTGRTANQLATLGKLGIFDGGFNEQHIPYYLKAKNIADISAPLETRVRSYIDANCSQCHRPNGVRAHFDARFTTPRAEQQIIHGAVDNGFTGETESVIKPGDVAHSVMYLRTSMVGTRQMPPLAKNMVDTYAVQQIQNWVNSMGNRPTVTLALNRIANVQRYLVDVTFSSPVTDLTASDFRVNYGSVVSLTGSGANYTLEVAALSGSSRDVLVYLAEGRAFAGELGNYESNRLALKKVDSGLVTWLQLDDASGVVASDSSTGGNAGAISNIVDTDWTVGRFGGALSFERANARMTLVNKLTNSFTVSFWIKPMEDFPSVATAQKGAPLLYAAVTGAADDFAICGTRSGEINRISVSVGTAGSIGAKFSLNGSRAVKKGEWSHVLVRRDKSTGAMDLYVNGLLDKFGTANTATLGANMTLEVGRSNTENTEYRGLIDQIRIYNRVITDSERLALDTDVQSTGSAIDTWYASVLPGMESLQSLDLDPDGDGLTNREEFAFNSDPLAPSLPPLQISALRVTSANLKYLNRTVKGGLVYTVEMSPDRAVWQAMGARFKNPGNAAGPTSDFQWTSGEFAPEATENAMFFRLKVSGDPQ